MEIVDKQVGGVIDVDVVERMRDLEVGGCPP